MKRNWKWITAGFAVLVMMASGFALPGTGVQRVQAKEYEEKEIEPNHGGFAPSWLESGDTVNGTLSQGDPEDNFCFELTKVSDVDITLEHGIANVWWTLEKEEYGIVDGRKLNESEGQELQTSKMHLRLKPGTYYIKLDLEHAEDFSYRMKLEITSQAKVTSVSITGKNVIMSGEKCQLTATVLPEDASSKKVIWSSEDTWYATVNPVTGVVKGKGSGTAEIVARSEDDLEVLGRFIIIIGPGQVKKIKVEPLGNRNVFIKWREADGVIPKYQIQYSKKRNFKKKKTMNWTEWENGAIAKLKMKGTLYFRIRALNKVEGIKFKGKWSKPIKVRVK